MKINSEPCQQWKGIIFLVVNGKINSSEPDLPSPQSSQYLTQHEVAQLLNVHTRTIRNWTYKGKLHVYRYGHRVFYKRHDLTNV